MAGSRWLTPDYYPFVESVLTALLGHIQGPFMLVFRVNNGADALGLRYAKEKNIHHTLLSSSKEMSLPEQIENIINRSTHLIAFWDNVSPTTKDIIDQASKNGLSIAWADIISGDIHRQKPE